MSQKPRVGSDAPQLYFFRLLNCTHKLIRKLFTGLFGTNRVLSAYRSIIVPAALRLMLILFLFITKARD